MSLFDRAMNSKWTVGILTGVLCSGLGYISIDSATTIETVQAVPSTDPFFPPMERCLKINAGKLRGFELSGIDIVTEHSLLWGLSQETKVTVVNKGMGADDGGNQLVFVTRPDGISTSDVTRLSGSDVKWWDGGKVVAVAGEFNACFESAKATINAMRGIQSWLKERRPVVRVSKPAGNEHSY